MSFFPSSEIPQIPKEAEPRSGLRFEPGMHDWPETHMGITFREVINRLEAGDTTLHLWNPEVAIRMKQYNPQIIGLDSESPSADRKPALYEEKRLMWYDLPARPKDFNTQGEVYLIRGDLNYVDTVLNLQGEGTSELRSEMFKRGQEEGERTIRDIYIEDLGTASLAFLINLSLAKTIKVKEFGVEKKVPAVLTRRGFLKYAGLGTLALASLVAFPGRNIIKGLAAQAGDEETRAQLQKIATIIKRRFMNSDWLDGRTALVIAKTEDSLDFLHKPESTPSSVVMGSDHMFNAEELMQNRIARETAIRTLAVKLAVTVDEVVAEYPQFSAVQARRELLDYLSLTEVVKVEDPGGPPNDPNLRRIINDNIKVESYFQSPQVESAIRELRL